MTPIGKAEFETLYKSYSRKPLIESLAILELKPGEGFTVPCRWNHWKANCYGSTKFRNYAKHHAVRISSGCKDGTVYVYRHEEATE